MIDRARAEGEESNERLFLLRPRDEISGKLSERIERGKELLCRPITNDAQYELVYNESTKWHDYNSTYLLQVFNRKTVADKYTQVPTLAYVGFGMSYPEMVESLKTGVGRQVKELEAVLEQLELYPERSRSQVSRSTAQISTSDSIFLVHGHDEAAKSSVARFMERLGVKVIILHEQPDRGQTIVEKFESSTSEVGFAVVLMTPDDLGGASIGPSDMKSRARQNVILELGYFCGALGRDRVCVLYKDGVEIPSDYLGVVYTPLDDGNGWHLKLAKELRHAGFDVDLNKAI